MSAATGWTQTNGHRCAPATFATLAHLSGYSPRTRGYVYGYRETCECGATRTVQYLDAHAAMDAHRYAREVDAVEVERC